MCNFYHMAPRDHVEVFFRTRVPDYAALPVGPFGTGLFLRGPADQLVGVIGRWGMIQPGARTRRPDSRAILTNNARAETVAARPTHRGAWAAGRRCLVPASWYPGAQLGDRQERLVAHAAPTASHGDRRTVVGGTDPATARSGLPSYDDHRQLRRPSAARSPA